MNPNLLKQLAMVVKQGSISAAAEQLFITQPTLTRSIQQLEQRVGAPVLKRSRYGMVPTEIGARLAQIGERILAEAAHGEEVIQQWQGGFHNEFTIGIDPLWEYAAAADMTTHLLRDTRYLFHLRNGSAALQIEWLQAGELDFLLAPAHLSVAQGELTREVLFRDRSAVFVGKKSELLGSKKAINPELLGRKNWLIAGASAGFLNSREDNTGPRMARMAFTGSLRSVFHLLQTTDMLVRLPARLSLMTAEIDTTQMIQIEGNPGARRDIALWYRAQDSERPDVMKVRDLLRDLLKRLDQQAPEFGLDL